MLCALILFVATWRGFISLPILFGVAALLGVARAFAGPAFGALAPNLVPRELLPRAIALSSTAWQSRRHRGPGARRHPLRRHAPPALRRERRPVRLLAPSACSPSRPIARPRIAAGKPAAADGERPRLCPAQSARARRHHARPVRRPARRRDGDASGLRPRHPSCRRRRPRAAARSARSRRDADRHLLLVPPAEGRMSG